MKYPFHRYIPPDFVPNTLVEHDPYLPGSDREFESRFPLQSLLEVPFP
ncbi:hypothetical protein M2366_000965 [Aeromonas sp. BIGb0405]|nr:hypothetical protein [Aeromonas sp. BIGb0405]